MADYSKHDILARLEQGSVMNGWGAVFALSRSTLNHSLQQHYLESYTQLTFLRALSARVSIDEGGSQSIGLAGLVLGPPQLSFENATMTHADATVRMNLLAGDFDHSSRSGAVMQLARSQSITEGMGFWVEAKVTLSAQVANVGMRVSISFDAGAATDFKSNLGTTEYARVMIGREFERWIKGQTDIQRLFTVAEFDLRDYLPGAPKQLLVRSQRAPWADDTPASKGDGSIIMFMQLNSDLETGRLPDRDFPYLVPCDATVDSTLLSDRYLQDMDCATPEDALGSLSLTNGRQFDAKETHTPCDVVIFGIIQDGPRTRNLVPAIGSVTAGNKLPFKLEGGNGGVEWAVRNIHRPLASGAVSTSGLYQARPNQDFVKEVQVSVVTGKYQSDDEHQRRAAVVVEQLTPVMVAPRTVLWGNGLPAVELVATSVGSSTLQWSLVGEQLGTLTVEQGRARFQPKPTEGEIPEIRLQRIRVSDGQSATEACVVIVASPGLIQVEPHHVLRQFSFEPVQFQSSSKSRVLERGQVTWSVFGEGSIDDSGLYTPPLAANTPCSVVMADVAGLISGYAIIEHGQRQAAPESSVSSWYKLERFYLKVISAPRCYANGLQQIQVRVTLRPEAVDGVYPPISDTELASLRFHFEKNAGVVRELNEAEDGIEPAPGDPGTWVMNRRRNSLLEMQAGKGALPAEAPLEEGDVIQDYWLQTTANAPETFYAAIQQDGADGGPPGRWITSLINLENGKITVQGMSPPPSVPELFGFESSRGYAEGQELDGDAFSYMTHTIDYWRLSYLKAEPLVNFVAMDVAPEDKKSLLRWSSDAFDDEFCSYTGFMFGGSKYKGLIYDGTLCRLASAQGLTLDPLPPSEAPAPGTLLVALSRVSNFRLRAEASEDPNNLADDDRATRDALNTPFRFKLIDQHGNRHHLQITFEGDQRSRNTLKLQIQPANL